jgi:hypothetical protein
MAVSNRVRDYCGFAVRFVGVGYIALWPLAVSDSFGPAGLCRPHAMPWELFCHWPQLIRLTPGLHLIGIACAGALAIYLALRAAARLRRAHASQANAALTLTAGVPPGFTRTPFVAPLPKVKPRSQFGLRGDPPSRGNSGVSSPTSKPKTPAQQP